MKSWDIPSLDLKPRLPEILSSTPEARAIALDLRAGEGLPDHEVHERAWLVVLAGNVEITSATGERVFRAAADCWLGTSRRRSATRSWPARTHVCSCCSPPGRAQVIPGAMTLRQKLYVRRRAAKRRAAARNRHQALVKHSSPAPLALSHRASPQRLEVAGR